MRKRAAELIFWFHLVIVVLWIGLFLVPLSWWKGKIAFHFFVTLGIIGHQYLWGAALIPWTKRFRPVCILTSLMQWVRGENLAGERNYQHSWSREFFTRLGWGVPERGAGVMTYGILLLVTLQYIFLR